MKQYHCYLMDAVGHILALTMLDCGDDESAKRQAATKFRDDPECRVIEVWEVGRRIARLNAPAGETEPRHTGGLRGHCRPDALAISEMTRTS